MRFSNEGTQLHTPLQKPEALAFEHGIRQPNEGSWYLLIKTNLHTPLLSSAKLHIHFPIRAWLTATNGLIPRHPSSNLHTSSHSTKWKCLLSSESFAFYAFHLFDNCNRTFKDQHEIKRQARHRQIYQNNSAPQRKL